MQLRVFVAVATERHFGRAALALGISQPQTSRHVATLERMLGVTLFARTARRVTLTDAGEALLDEARETLRSVARLQRRARSVARGHLGAVSVGFLWSTLPGYLAPLVAATGERHPEIQLSVSQLRFVEIVGALRRGDVDLVITRPSLGETELIITELNREASFLAVPADHPFAGREALERRDLDGASIITLARERIPAAYDLAREQMRAAGIAPADLRSASSPSEALALVAAGLGVYFRVPGSALAPWPGVVYRELCDIPAETLLVRGPEPPAPAVAAIAALARELFGDAPGVSDNARRRLEAGLAAP